MPAAAPEFMFPSFSCSACPNRTACNSNDAVLGVWVWGFGGLGLGVWVWVWVWVWGWGWACVCACVARALSLCLCLCLCRSVSLSVSLCLSLSLSVCVCVYLSVWVVRVVQTLGNHGRRVRIAGPRLQNMRRKSPPDSTATAPCSPPPFLAPPPNCLHKMPLKLQSGLSSHMDRGRTPTRLRW